MLMHGVHGSYLPREKATSGDKPFAFTEKDQVVMRVDNWTWLEPGQYRDRFATDK